MSNIKVIAHYFPQFHTIPENDEWWGKNFTDWTNVQKAQPLFPGHYQPHIPDNYLGYYDLSDVNEQKKQVQLAKQYGIYGFCFYTYWFNGKRLLEKPLDNYLDNKELDFPFCICWANENWSRRWDGRDNDILIEQKYSPKDDIEFIKDMSKYIKDPRYIKIDNKPLILVYRPDILPNAQETVNRWRDWCRQNDIGEIYLSYTQSFTNENPKKYGFDAASEFPPNDGDMALNIDNSFRHNESVINTIDWNHYLIRTYNYKNVGYKLFRCIMPSWDNSPRKKHESYALINSDPAYFQTMAENAFEYTSRNHTDEEKIVFVNAWNEWGEGCHLEPDKKYGCSWLEAIKNAQFLTSKPSKNSISEVKNFCIDSISAKTNEIKQKEIAIVYHSFYPEYLNETIDYAESCKDLHGCWFIITAPKEKLEQCKKIVSEKSNKFQFLFLEINNKGKDILPFFKIYNTLIDLNIRVFCKLHSKKSPYRWDGDLWRKELISTLLQPKNIKNIIKILSQKTNIGIVSHKKYTYFLDSQIFNSPIMLQRVQRLAKLLGETDISKQIFPGGSMFWARTESLMPMYKLLHPENEDYYPEESDQRDNTMAHVLERLFCISASSIGLKTIFVGSNK